MEVESEAASGEITWRYDTGSSKILRGIAHGFVAGIGGLLGFAFAVVLLTLPENLPKLEFETILLVVLLFLVGGPFSLLYLWPMISDPDQRPNATAFTSKDGSIPWTKRSATVTALLGTVILGGLLLVDATPNLVFSLIVVSIFSPVVVSLFTTVGTISDNRLVCNGNGVQLKQIKGMYSLQIGSAVVVWLTYTSGSGLLVPRFITIPAEIVEDVTAKLEQGLERNPGG